MTDCTYCYTLAARDIFIGVILVTSSLQYFTDFWQPASNGHFFPGMFCRDGEIDIPLFTDYGISDAQILANWRRDMREPVRADGDGVSGPSRNLNRAPKSQAWRHRPPLAPHRHRT